MSTLRLIDSFPPSGSKDVPPVSGGRVRLQFSQNVASTSVFGFNKTQIQAFRGLERIPIRVLGSSANPRFLGVFIDEKIRQNSHYKIVILPKLVSTTGQRIDETVIVFYNTGNLLSIPC